MTAARQMRAANYAVKREAGFTCNGCSKTDQLLVVTETGVEDPFVLCSNCVATADGRSVKVRPNQWDEAERLREQIAKAR